MNKADRERLAALDRQLDHWAATDKEQRANVARLQAERDASGETARMIARGEAYQRKFHAFHAKEIAMVRGCK